ncbi:MAG: nucleoside triphosphate pyrophosphohydrolase [Treponema sp.]|nr:nucleoside triphosphate pyrophosphohydrolase [Treponema sp.]MCL2251281.1 nucleoside triphosphate pyrophosphohydrolase [Treponema sp.]
MNVSESFKALYDTIVKLRGPDGCKWDKEQTPSSLRSALVEETYECLEAIDEKNPAHIAEELGDIFLLTTMIGYMHEQEGKFTVADTLTGIKDKLIRRHPHVFGDVKVKDTNEILDNWAAIKIQEGRKPKDSILDEVSSGVPPMDRSFALQKKAAKAGFDWQDIEGVIEKINEELKEVQEATANSFYAQLTDDKENRQLTDAVEEELGDLLFAVINLCRFLKVDPSAALHRTNVKFVKRFKFVEKKMKEKGHEMKKENLDIMDAFWEEAKG